MYRCFSNRQVEIGESLIIDEYNHIVNVLRMTPGQELELASDNGVFLCFIESIDGEVKVKVKEDIGMDNESPIKIHLYQALAKGDKLEYVIKKSVELGVNQITPIEAKKCVVKLQGNKKVKKVERYNTISESAAKQSKRDFIPRVNSILDIDSVPCENLLVAYEKEGAGLKDTLKNFKGKELSILIGPEGGLEEKEVEILKSKGARVINFGNRILRTETAGLFLISAIQYELGDMG